MFVQERQARAGVMVGERQAWQAASKRCGSRRQEGGRYISICTGSAQQVGGILYEVQIQNQAEAVSCSIHRRTNPRVESMRCYNRRIVVCNASRQAETVGPSGNLYPWQRYVPGIPVCEVCGGRKQNENAMLCNPPRYSPMQGKVRFVNGRRRQ